MNDRPAEFNMSQPFEYVVVVSLPLDAVSYVVRSADDEFFAGLKAGKFCYVLNSRQMGKSSLRVRTMARLQADGIVCVSIDMTAIGSAEVTAEQWYLGVLWAIVKQVREQTSGLESWKLPVLRSWWVEREGLSFVQRWGEFIEVLLGEVGERVVIFVDEIDSVLGLGFRADDFFAAIRECYNRRVDESQYDRLTFALLGVCAPQDLIQDKRRTPFNVGQAIELSGFSYEEAIGLAKGLPGGDEMLRSILAWTGGQPFLTQRVCRLATEMKPPNPQFWGDMSVDEVVQERIIRVWESNDEQVHFQTIADRMMADESLAGAMLGMYQRVLAEGGVGIDGSEEQIALRLTGVVVKRGDRLCVMNRIYEGVFGSEWVSGKLAALRPYGENLTKWQETKNNMWLLSGDGLRLAKVWMNEKNRKLAPEDYLFMLASLEWKVAFHFENGSASDTSSLIELCEKYPKEAWTYLRNEYLEKWLVGYLGQPRLAAAAYSVRREYAKDPGQAIEIFIRELYKYQGEDGDPIVILESQKLDIGEIPIGGKREIKIRVRILGRGFIWGDIITSVQQTSGITISNKFDSRVSENITVTIDLSRQIGIVKNGLYAFSATLFVKGTERTHEFRISYEVVSVKVKVTPISLNLGVIQRIGKQKKGNLLVTIQKEDGLTILGSATSLNPSVLHVSPFNFNDSIPIEYRISPRNSVTGTIQTSINISVNKDVINVPISFTLGIDYVHLFLSYFPIGLILAIALGLVRGGIEADNFSKNSLASFAVIMIVGFSLALPSFLQFFLVEPRGNIVARNMLSTSHNNDSSSLTVVIYVFLGLICSFFIEQLGLLSSVGYIFVVLIDLISSIFYVLGIASMNLRWSIFSYVILHIYLIYKASRKIWIKESQSNFS